MRPALLLLAAACAAPAQTGGRGVRPASSPPAKPAAKPDGRPSPRDLKYAPLHVVQPPKVTTSTLPNGLRLYLSEQHEIPVIGGVVMVRAGSAFDPPERIGLAAIAGQLLRSGGTEQKSGEQVDETLSRLGMTVETNFSETAGILTFSSLARNAEGSLTILREMLTRPEFRQDRLEQAKTRMRAAIAKRKDDYPTLMQNELAGLVFGKDSPYGWRTNYAGIERITRVDLKNFHKRFFAPANMMLCVWGDFDAAQMKATVEKLFGDWTSPQPAPGAFPRATASPAPGLYLGENREVAVSHILVGQAGGTVNQKDHAALDVTGLLFNQLQARIMRRVRAQVGAANLSLFGAGVDDVKATWGARFDHQGLFRIYATCRSPSTVEAVRAIYEDIVRMRSIEVTDDELRIAKESALATLAGNWDGTSEAYVRLMTQEYYGLPRDFAEQYQASIAAVSRADVLRVAKEYLDPAMMTTIVVGNPQVFSTPIENLNPQVNRIDLTVPEPKPIVTESSDASMAAGKKLLQRAQAAAGGADKLAAVKDYLIAAEYQIDPLVPDIGGNQVLETDRWISPAVFRQDLTLPTGRINAYSDGKSGWIATRQGWGALAGIQLKQLQGDLFRLYFRVLLSDRLEGRTVNQVDQDLVEITDTTGQIVRIEFDPETGLPRRATYDVPHQLSAPIFTEDLYSDFREVGGIKFPFKTVIKQTGRKFADVVVTDLKVNSGLRQVELAMRPQ